MDVVYVLWTNLHERSVNSTPIITQLTDLPACHKFYKRLYFKSGFIGFIHDMFWASLISDRSDDCLRSVFVRLHIAIENVHSRVCS